MRVDPLTAALLGSTSGSGRLLIRRPMTLPVANPLALPSITREAPQPIKIPTRQVKPAVRVTLVKTPSWSPTPPRNLTEHQRLELMFPGLLWYAQADSVGKDHPSMHVITKPLGNDFMGSTVEVTDDIPSEAEATELVSKAITIVGEILDPIDQIERGVVMIALDMWLQRLLTNGVLVLYEGSLFANALKKWNTSIMSEPENRRRFPSLLRPAEHHARGITRRFQEREFYVEGKTC